MKKILIYTKDELTALSNNIELQDDFEIVLVDNDMLAEFLEETTPHIANSHTVIGFNDVQLYLVEDSFLSEKAGIFAQENKQQLSELIGCFETEKPQIGTYDYFYEMVSRLQLELTQVPIDHYASFHDAVMSLLWERYSNEDMDSVENNNGKSPPANDFWASSLYSASRAMNEKNTRS